MARFRQFFDDYADALGQGNVDRIAAAYAEHFMLTGPDFRMNMDNDAQFHTELAQTVQFYKQIGMDVVEVKNYLEAELGSGFWLTKVEWELLDEDLNTIVTFDNTYLVEAGLVEAGGNGEQSTKIVFTIAHNEHARMQEQGLIS